MEYMVEEYGIAAVILMIGTAIVLGFCAVFHVM